MKRLRFRKLHPDAVLPTRNKADDAGLDLYALGRAVFMPGERRKLPLGIAVEIPKGFEGQIRPRSGLTDKHGLIAQLGTIDASYRGELSCVLIHNSTADAYTVEPGDRIAQLVISPIALPQAEWAEELTEGARGAKGWGSSGR